MSGSASTGWSLPLTLRVNFWAMMFPSHDGAVWQSNPTVAEWKPAYTLLGPRASRAPAGGTPAVRSCADLPGVVKWPLQERAEPTIGVRYGTLQVLKGGAIIRNVGDAGGP